MKKSALTIFSFLLVQTSFASDLIKASRCDLTTSPTESFPLIETSNGFEASRSMASSFFELNLMDPSELEGWPDYGGTYYRGGEDLWVIITPKDAKLPRGVNFKVIKPLERDPNTDTRPATYLCHKTL